MKMIAYGKYDPKDEDKVAKKNAEIQEERKKFPNRYPKPLSEVYYTTSSKFFRLYEGTQEQFLNLTARWIPETEFHCESIFTISDRQEATKRIK